MKREPKGFKVSPRNSKYGQMSPEEQNRYGEIIKSANAQIIEPVPPEDAAAQILSGMKEDSATGPDLLPTKMLRECADVLANQFRKLALLIFKQGRS